MNGSFLTSLVRLNLIVATVIVMPGCVMTKPLSDESRQSQACHEDEVRAFLEDDDNQGTNAGVFKSFLKKYETCQSAVRANMKSFESGGKTFRIAFDLTIQTKTRNGIVEGCITRQLVGFPPDKYRICFDRVPKRWTKI